MDCVPELKRQQNSQGLKGQELEQLWGSKEHEVYSLYYVYDAYMGVSLLQPFAIISFSKLKYFIHKDQVEEMMSSTTISGTQYYPII